MTTARENYTLLEIGSFTNLLERNYNGLDGKFFLGSELGLTGCEVSVNRLPAGKAMPFAHAHKQNEEIYIITGGEGTFYIDGDEFPVQEGSLLRIAPKGQRSWKAGARDLYFICIQAKEGSLSQATKQDGLLSPVKASWMQR